MLYRESRGLLFLIFELITANVGFHKHHSIFWTIIDAILMPITWIKWILLQEVNFTMIEQSFNWFLK